MELVINQRKIKHPLAIIALILFSLSLVAGVIALILLVILPLIGIFLSGVLALALIIITPIILWFVLPIIFLTIIAWFFGKFLK